LPPTVPTPERPRSRGALPWLRNSLIAGIAVLFPVGVTMWFMKFVGYDLLDHPARKALAWLVRLFLPDPVASPERGIAWTIEHKWVGLGIAVAILFIFVVGIVARSFFGRQIIRLAEYVVERVPLVRTIYNGLKQLSDAVLTKTGTESFRQAVLVKFMGEDAYAVGFVTGETQGEAQAVTPERVMNVFVPTTPNPTSGYLLMVPADRLIHLQMTVEEALKMVISGGMVTPPAPPDVREATRPQKRAPVGTGAAAEGE
jgi:uncharacterized membrane protein